MTSEQNSNIDTGTTGAKRQSWRKDNPRDVLKRIIDENPASSEGDVQELAWHEMRDHIGYMRTIFEYWFANNFRSLAAQIESPIKSRRETIAATRRRINERKETLRRRLDEKIEQRIKIALLDMILPTGKTLRDSSREELIALGGWAAKVADNLHEGQTVGDAGLSEEILRSLYEAEPQ